METKSQNYFSHERHCAARSPSTASAFRSTMYTPLSAAPRTPSSVRLPLDCSASPHRGHKGGGGRLSTLSNKKHCMCSPSTNPGAFRCSLHRSSGNRPPSLASDKRPSQSLNFRMAVMINSMMKIGGDEEEGDLMRRVQYNFIRRLSSSNRPQQRRLDFKHRPTRFHVAFMEGQGSE